MAGITGTNLYRTRNQQNRPLRATVAGKSLVNSFGEGAELRK